MNSFVNFFFCGTDRRSSVWSHPFWSVLQQGVGDCYKVRCMDVCLSTKFPYFCVKWLFLFAVLGMILTDFLSFRCLNPNPEERPDIVEVRCCAESLQCQTLHLRGSKWSVSFWNEANMSETYSLALFTVARRFNV